MALMSALLGQLRPLRGRTAAARPAGRVILHGQSRRAYAFELHSAAARLEDSPAVYIYARRRSSEVDGARGGAAGAFDIGFVGHTEAMGRRAEEHERFGHFVGHGFDTLLLLNVEHELIRIGIAEDMLAAHRPVLNELLRRYHDAGLS